MLRLAQGSPGGNVVDVVGGGAVLDVLVVVVVEGGGRLVLDVIDVVVTVGDGVVVELDDTGGSVVDDVVPDGAVDDVVGPGAPIGVVAVVLVVEVVVERPGRGRVVLVVLVVGVGVSDGAGQLAGTGAARATKRPGSSRRIFPPNTRQ